ncbi:MAG: integrase, partial [Oxalobacteraceae bacterium]
LATIETVWGKTPIRFIEAPGFRGDLKAWRDTMAATPRKADLAWAVMARVLSVAKDRGRIKENPCARGGRLYKADRVDSIWTDEIIERARANLPKELGHAMMLALWTGQRQGDLLTLPWSAIDGHFIRLKQSKGGRRVAVKIIRPLRELLSGLPRTQKTILTNSRGTSWTSSGFRASWGKAIAALGIEGLTFHDLRGSAATRLAEAGCTDQEIASITGHSAETVSAMLDKHYLSRTDAISTNAGDKLEAAEEKRNSKPPDKPEDSVCPGGLPAEPET